MYTHFSWLTTIIRELVTPYKTCMEKYTSRYMPHDVRLHYATKKKSLVGVNFFRQKVFLWPKTNSHLVGRAEKIAFPPLNYDRKVKFWLFLAVLTCCVQHCSHSRASASVQLASLESSDTFYVGGFYTEVPMGSWRDDTRTRIVIMVKYIPTQPSIHFIHPNKFFWVF